MNELITRAAPLCLALSFGLIGVTAALISSGKTFYAESDPARRQALARVVLLGAVPQNLSLAAFSFDIWALTAMLTADSRTLLTYNLTGKASAIVVLIVVHILLYILVLAWGGVVRSTTDRPTLELLISALAILLCVVFQGYGP